MKLTEEQQTIHKEFRSYLKKDEKETGYMLNTLINAAEKNLPALINACFDIHMDCIYDGTYSIEELLYIARKIKSDEKIFAGPYGYISSKAIDAYLRYLAKKNGIDLNSITVPDNVLTPKNVSSDDIDSVSKIEGRLSEARILRRQRNRVVREQCLREANYTCYVCGFNFEKAYGPLGRGFMEVHHKRPLSTYDEEHEIPIEELCALCSNCHSMVHRKKDSVLDVDELKHIWEQALSH